MSTFATEVTVTNQSATKHSSNDSIDSMKFVTESFESVYVRNWQPLYRLATMMVSNRAEGEDLAQEAFTQWYVRRESIQNPDAYLRTVVLNLCTGRYRKRATVGRHAHLFVARSEVEAVQDPLLDVINRLPMKQKAAVMLRYYEGRGDDEIAAILACRPGTVRSLLSRAMATMRTEVER
jgi:RNA polymerase sigma factor (sigma-70 family)